MTEDWLDFIRELVAAKAQFMICGAHALAIHGVPRATQDIDIWINHAEANARAVAEALTAFGAPLDALQISIDDLTRENNVIQIGVAPNRIDILTSLSGLPDFNAAWGARVEQTVAGLSIPFLGKAELIATKRASGRTKDLADLERLR
jgi:hypothetical protein